MKKDNYIQRELWKYGIQAQSIIAPAKIEDYFEYLYSLLKETDIKRVVSFVRGELDTYSKEKGLFDEIKYSKDSKEKKPIEISDEEDVIESIKHDLKRASFDSNKWQRVFPELRTHYRHIYLMALKNIISCLERYLKSPTRKSIYEKNLRSIQKTFRLSDKECEIVTFLYLLQFDREAEGLFQHDLDMNEIVKSTRLYCRFFKLTPRHLKELMSKDSKLIRSGIITKSRRGNDLVISDMVTSYLAGFSRLDLLDNFIHKADCAKALALTEHNLQLEKINNTKNLILSNKGTNILLFGKPGTGKTEFVKSLGKTLNKKVYFINQKDEDGDENLDHRKSGIVAAMNMLDPKKSIVVVDECDGIINVNDGFWKCENGDKDNKAWINDLLENSNQNFIWISNRIDGVDESTKRRFSYSIEFLNLGHSQRVKVWENQVASASIDFMDRELIESFAKKYQVNAGGIALALKDVASMKSIRTKKEKIEVLQSILAQHQSFVFGNNKLNPLSGTYSLEVLNCDINLESVINTSKRFIDYIAQADANEISNMNFLLQGPPGTGKTEFIKYMSQTIGKELVVKRMSDLQSMYVGETEKLIASVFKDAESSGAVLFLDEADSLFINRESAVRSWEVSQTNELLCQMENFRGILACATNFSQNMDGAVMRRFNYKIKFDFLAADAKEQLFLKMLGEKLDRNLTDEELSRIRRIPNLTPGDFKVVRQKNFFSDVLDANVLIEQLEMESSYKKKERAIGIAP